VAAGYSGSRGLRRPDVLCHDDPQYNTPPPPLPLPLSLLLLLLLLMRSVGRERAASVVDVTYDLACPCIVNKRRCWQAAARNLPTDADADAVHTAQR